MTGIVTAWSDCVCCETGIVTVWSDCVCCAWHCCQIVFAVCGTVVRLCAVRQAL